MSDISDINEMLTLGRIRGMYHSEDRFSKLPLTDLYELRDWLDLVSDEIYQMKRAAMREIFGRGNSNEPDQTTT